jgi:hypothetical protein
LGIFAALNLCGLSESANVALLIFVAHIFTLTLLCATAFAYMAQVQPAFLFRQPCVRYGTRSSPN